MRPLFAESVFTFFTTVLYPGNRRSTANWLYVLTPWKIALPYQFVFYLILESTPSCWDVDTVNFPYNFLRSSKDLIFDRSDRCELAPFAAVIEGFILLYYSRINGRRILAELAISIFFNWSSSARRLWHFYFYFWSKSYGWYYYRPSPPYLERRSGSIKQPTILHQRCHLSSLSFLLFSCLYLV